MRWLEAQEVGGLYYLCSENKGDDQLRTDLRLCFRICKIRFSHDRAQIKSFCRTNNIHESRPKTKDYSSLG